MNLTDRERVSRLYLLLFYFKSDPNHYSESQWYIFFLITNIV